MKRRDVIKLLRKLNTDFYWTCFRARVGEVAHPFLEFNGLMSKYIDVLDRSGLDPHLASVHNEVQMDVEEHDICYLAEKFACIFAPMLRAHPEALTWFIEALKDNELKMCAKKMGLDL